jgi:CheY-like chemotaxis protein
LKRVVPEVKGDTGQIQQIIMNLIINAAEAIGDNKGTIRVALTRILVKADQTETDIFGTVIQPGGYICLDVSDNGCGMDEETQKRIFEPFFTTKFTGRGLGMSAIHGIIKSHDGALQLTSTPGVGTTFKVFFPVPKATDNAEVTLNTTVQIEEAGGTILLVEDEELLLIMGKELLDAMGFSAMTALNGSEALEIYRERGREIDVILMDLIMPVMGGIEAYHELRKLNPTVPIIICSGYGVESVENVIGNDPHAGFVHKPYKPDELRDMLARMMGVVN